MKSNQYLIKPIKLTKNYLKKAAEISSRAFFDDPIIKFVYSTNKKVIDEKKKLKQIYSIYRMLYKIRIYNGETYTISNKLEGIAIWNSPDNIHLSFGDILKSGMIVSLLNNLLYLKKMRKGMAVLNYMESVHKRLITFDHWYLKHIAVKPEEQGKGYGSYLLNSMFEVIDVQGLPVYVDTNNEKNITFYQKNGFEVINYEIIPGTDISLFCMLRKGRGIKV